MKKTVIINEKQSRFIAKRRLHEVNSYDPSEIGEIACTLDFDEDWYQEYLQDNELTDSPQAKEEYIRNECTYDVELYDAETYHQCGYEQMTIEEIEENFGAAIAADVFKECMDGKEHRYEPLAYDNEVVDLNNPVALSDAAMKRLQHGDYSKDCRGFILPNGVVVYTGAEHNMCSQIPGVNGTYHFIELGCIRVLDHSVDLAVAPTSEQWNTLWKVFNAYYGDTLYLDLMNKKIGTASKQYSGLDPQEAIDDIKNYFNYGVKPRADIYGMYESVFKGKKKDFNKWFRKLNESNLPQTNLLQQFEKKYGELSDNGKKWFEGLMKGALFGVTMDEILFKAVFSMLGMTPFGIGGQVDNEWDELDGILRVAINKTGYGQEILERLRTTRGDRNIISDEEMAEFKKRLEYYPNIYEELVRCYDIFSRVAPAIYKAKNYLKSYNHGIPALEFCYIVGRIREKNRAALDVAVKQALEGSKPVLPQLNESVSEKTLYHGSCADFNQFDEKYVLSGVGHMDYGYGFYLTDSKNTAHDYALGGKLYTVEAPDGKYLNAGRISRGEAMRVARNFYNYYLNTDYGKEAYGSQGNEFWEYECKYVAEATDGNTLYGTISSILGSDKDTSAYLRSIGYVGLEIDGDNGTTGEVFKNYLIFDQSDITITGKCDF